MSSPRAAMTDWAQSLTRHGFERIYWLNGHGGNIATITAAFSEIYHSATFAGAGNKPALRCHLRNWWELPGVMDLCRRLFPVGEGSHATPSEISVTWFGYPETARPPQELSPKIAPTGPILDADDYRRRFPDGRIGSDPAQASIEAGGKLVAMAVQGVIQEFRHFAA